MKTTVSLLGVFALLFIAFAPSATAGKPPELLSYQGYLVDANGVPLGSSGGNPLPANYDVEFRIYSAPTGGNLLWAEQQTITVDNGYFSVLLGEGSQIGSEDRPNLSVIFNHATASERFVGISVRFAVGGEFNEILPRLRLLSSPYAFLSTSATQLVNQQGGTLVSTDGTNVNVSGTINATSYAGNGASLTNLQATNLTGTLAVARIPNLDASKTTAGVFALARIPALDASRIPNLDASKITSGTLDQARIPSVLSGNRRFNNNVGIGVSPTVPLHVTGSGWPLALVEGSATVGTWLALGNSSTGGQFWHLISTGSANAGGAGKLLIGTGGAGGSSDHRMVFQPNGHIGIGTLTPGYPLHVTRATGGWSIVTSGHILAAGVGLISDARVKDVLGTSDSRNDLEIIRQLRVADYSSVDTIRFGERMSKGFIAQEVQEIAPEFATLMTRFIPNLYAYPLSFSYDNSANHLTVTLAEEHDLAEGDRVEILADGARLELPVIAVLSSTEFLLGDCLEKPEDIFVYGKEVDDFMSLRYDQIFTTGISAIQELIREVDELRVYTAQLEQDLDRMSLLEREVSELRAAVQILIEAQTGGQ